MTCSAGVCSPAFWVAMAASRSVSPERAFNCSDTTLKAVCRASFSVVRVASCAEYSRMWLPLCASWFSVALSSSRCVTEAKTVAVSLTERPGLSTHPCPTLIPSNGLLPTESAWVVFCPGRCTVSWPASAFSTVMLSPPFSRVSGIFPSTDRRSPFATGSLSARNNDH